LDKIKVVAADPLWPSRFQSEASRLVAVLPSNLIGQLHHIGSTAVPGLAAKPIIDIMILTPSLSAARAALVDPLQQEGYAFWADNPATDRLFFVKGLPPSTPRRTHHIHVIDCLQTLQRHLTFRDRLRNDPKERARYQALKLHLASKHAADRDAYTAAKADYINGVLS
jgi:GrpB-like predicted nucleotidyltransferase (UPF0157 family)